MIFQKRIFKRYPDLCAVVLTTSLLSRIQSLPKKQSTQIRTILLLSSAPGEILLQPFSSLEENYVGTGFNPERATIFFFSV